METPDEIQDIVARNTERFLRDGSRLRYDNKIFVIAKDTRNGRVLLGGLGGTGVGQMWFSLSEHNKEMSGYEEAPDIDSDVQDAQWEYFTGKLRIWNRPVEERNDG